MKRKKAKESAQVARARRTLERKIEQEHQQMTQEKLAETARLIERQLGRHAEERIDLKSKEIELFDANRHPAAVKSKFVTHLFGDLKRTGGQPLKGRVKK